MTDPQPAGLLAVLAGCRFVLLDFDGPVCDIYAGHPAEQVAENLRTQLATLYTGPLPDDVAATTDPLVIVRQVAEFAPHLSTDIDDALTAAELHAVTTAEPTLGVAAFLHACQATGRPVAIVSNNSAPAIEAYLKLHELTDYVQHVQGRDSSDPRRMKPSTFLLAEAVAVLDADPATTIMIGDSSTDIDAAQTYGVTAIGVVNKPGKEHALSHADALISDMRQLANAAASTKPTARTQAQS